MIGIGTDIVEISRIKKAMKKESFLKKYFTEKEIEYFQSKKMKSETVAGTFAAKEAVSKALGTGFAGFKANEVEILHNDEGMPFVSLHKNASEIAKNKGIAKIHISISHSDDYATAFAVAEGGNFDESVDFSPNEGDRPNIRRRIRNPKYSSYGKRRKSGI